MKQKKLLFSVALFFLVMVFVLNQRSVHAENAKPIEQEIYSNFIIDSKTITVNNQKFTALFGNDYIYVIDNEGKIIKKLNFFKDSTYLSYVSSNATDFNTKNLSFEVVSDIDKKGVSDFLVIIKKYDFESVIAISYEDNKVLWTYKPTMKTSRICGVNSYCNEALEISNYKLDGNLYVASGYQLDEVDINTGKIKNQYLYKNNIWDVALVSDINNNGSKDIALAVQPTKVIFIDGKTFKYIRDINVAKDLTLFNRSYKIERNIWSLEYVDGSDTLYAASEDGSVYEISVKNNTIDNVTSVFQTSEFIYGNIIDSGNEDKFESYTSAGVEHVFFGNYMKDYTYIKLYKMASIDQDSIGDILVEYQPDISNYTTYAICSSENGCDVNPDNTKPFLGVHGENVYYNSSLGPVVKNLKTNKVIMNLYKDDVFSQYKNEFDMPKMSLYMSDDGFIVNVDSNILYSFNSNGTKDAPLWTLPIMNYQTYEQTEDRLVIYNNITDQTYDGFTIYNEESKKMTSYLAEGNLIINHLLNGQNLFITENNGMNYYLRLFNLQTGNKVADNNLNDLISNSVDAKKIIALYSDIYADTNNDGYNEILLKIQYLNPKDEMKYAFILLDSKNNKVLHQLTFDEKVQIESPVIYDDLTSDHMPELVTIKYNSETNTTVNVYNIMTESKYKDFTFEGIHSALHFIKGIIDLNGDGSKEIILDHNILSMNNENASLNNAYIIDLKNNKFATISNNLNANMNFIIKDYAQDINHDGKNEIVVYDTNVKGSLPDTYPIRVNIYNYDNGQLTTKFTEDMTIGVELIKDGESADYVAFADTNNDGTKEVILTQSDKENNYKIVIKDLTGKIIKTYTKNFLTRKQDVQLEPKSTRNKPMKVINYLDHEYVKIAASGYYTYMSAMFDSKDFTIWDYVSVNFKGVYKDKFLFNDEYSKLLNITTPISTHDIKIKIQGLFHNTYYFKVNSKIGLKSVHISYQNIPYTEFKGNSIKVSLPESKYDMIYLIRTNDGATYYYTDFFEIKDSLTQTFIQFALLIAFSSGIYFTTRYFITKSYLRR